MFSSTEAQSRGWQMRDVRLLLTGGPCELVADTGGIFIGRPVLRAVTPVKELGTFANLGRRVLSNPAHFVRRPLAGHLHGAVAKKCFLRGNQHV